jgi:hypothetical protein
MRRGCALHFLPAAQLVAHLILFQLHTTQEVVAPNYFVQELLLVLEALQP